MNHCAIQQNGVVRSREDMRSSLTAAAASTMFTPERHHRREALVCPKPRRVGVVSGAISDPSRPLRWQLSHQAELSDSKAGSELLDIILAKGGRVSERSGANSSTTQVGSSSPFFCGSPPSRVSNPLIQDARFQEEKLLLPPVTAGCPRPSSPGPSSGSPMSPARKGGCVRASFGNNPAVRIEGFDCLDRDRSRSCSIPALA